MCSQLLGDTFSANPDSLSVSLNELVLAGLSQYKSEPVLELKEKPLEWWKSHYQLYPPIQQRWHVNIWVWLLHQYHQRDFLVLLAILSMQSDQHLIQRLLKVLFFILITFHSYLFPIQKSSQLNACLLLCNTCRKFLLNNS